MKTIINSAPFAFIFSAAIFFGVAMASYEIAVEIQAAGVEAIKAIVGCNHA